MRDPALIVVADDYGLCSAYDAGILEAASAGALDAVSAFATRESDPSPLLATGVAVGLHLEIPGWGADRDRRAGPGDREAALAALHDQLGRFEALFSGPPAHLDGHHHCHAAPGLAAAIAREAAPLGLPTRSIGPGHRRTLRCLGVATPDRLVGRLDERDPALPAELRRLAMGEGELPPGATEWMVHPGYPDRSARSSYDAGRAEDLRLVLDLARRPEARKVRATHAEALAPRS